MKMKLILPSIACLFVAASSVDCDDIYGRTGHGIDTCPNSHPDKDAGLCYPNCQDGYSDDGAALCWEDCDGDIVGPLCVERPLNIRGKDMYSRGVGVIPKDCNAGDVNIAGFCHKPCNSGYNYCGFGNCCRDCKSGYEYHSWSNTCFKHVFDFYNAGVTKYANPTGLGYIPTACPSGKENIAGLCYTKCKSGYKSDIYGMFGLIDLTLCWEQCSGDEIDDGKTCRITEQSHFRKSYGRGAGKPLQCADDEEQQLLTCYPKCRDGYVSEGGQGCYANPQTCTEPTTPTKEQTPDPTAKPTPSPTVSPTVVDDVITADAYGFVSDKTCEAYGMEKIDDPIVCKDAASKLAGTNGIRMDYKFIDVVDYKGPGRPQGCSYHRFGNVEQWHHGYDEECTVNGFAGCLCKVVPIKEPTTFSHLGCYKDTGDRAMDHLENGITSIEECRDLCKENGYLLFGLQYPPNGECFCGNDKDEAMQFGKATNCEGGRGGTWSLDIYEMNNILFDSGNQIFEPSQEEIARIPFGDSMLFSMDITINNLPTHPNFDTLFYCVVDAEKSVLPHLDRQIVVAMNRNSNDPNHGFAGFRVAVPTINNWSNAKQTFAIDEGNTYHLEFILTQSSLAIIQDGVVVFEDDNYAKHAVYDSVPCYVGHPTKDNDVVDVTIRNILIEGAKQTSQRSRLLGANYH